MEMKRTLEVLLTIGDAFDFLVDGIFELLSMAWQLTRLLELLKRVWLRDLHRWPSESLQEHISSTISYPFKSTSYIFCYFIYIFIYVYILCSMYFYVFLAFIVDIVVFVERGAASPAAGQPHLIDSSAEAKGRPREPRKPCGSC